MKASEARTLTQHAKEKAAKEAEIDAQKQVDTIFLALVAKTIETIKEWASSGQSSTIIWEKDTNYDCGLDRWDEIARDRLQLHFQSEGYQVEVLHTTQNKGESWALRATW